MRSVLGLVTCSLASMLFVGCICPGGYYDPVTGLVYNRGFRPVSRCARSPFKRGHHHQRQVSPCQPGQWPTGSQPSSCCGASVPTAYVPNPSNMNVSPYGDIGNQPGCCGSSVVPAEPSFVTGGTVIPAQPNCASCGSPMPTTNGGYDNYGPIESGCSSCGGVFGNSAGEVIGNGVPTPAVPQTKGSAPTGSSMPPVPSTEQIPAPPAETSLMMVPPNGAYESWKLPQTTNGTGPAVRQTQHTRWVPRKL